MAVELTHYHFLSNVQIILGPAFLAGHILSDYLCLRVVVGPVYSGDDVLVFEVRGASVGVAAFFGDHLLLALN